MLIFLFFVRALLDPLLDTTKLHIFGEDIGVGGGINLFVILLAGILVLRNRERPFSHPFCKCWILFLVICAIAVSYSPDLGRALKFFLNLVTYMSIAIIPFFVVCTI